MKPKRKMKKKNNNKVNLKKKRKKRKKEKRREVGREGYNSNCDKEKGKNPNVFDVNTLFFC